MTRVWVVEKECEESTMVLGVFSAKARAIAYINSLRGFMSQELACTEYDLDDPVFVTPPREPDGPVCSKCRRPAVRGRALGRQWSHGVPGPYFCSECEP